MTGCLGLAGLLLFMGTWFGGYVFYAFFGPGNPLLAFAFGAVMLAGFWNFFSTVMVRTGPMDVQAAKIAAEYADDPVYSAGRFAASRLGEYVGWGVTFLIGGFALLCAIMAAFAMAEGDDSARVLAMLSGSASVLTYYVLFYLAKANEQ